MVTEGGHAKPRAGTQNDTPLDGILQLPDIPRPCVCQQFVHLGFRDSLKWFSRLAGVYPKEVVREWRDVFYSIPQRRNNDRKHIQPVVEILPEPAAGDLLTQIPIGCRNQAKVGPDRFQAADALELLGLKDSQKTGLNVHGHVADLIQKQCSTVGQLKPADLPGPGTGERSCLVTE